MMTNEEFEDIVRQTIDDLPPEFKSQLDNVEVIIEDGESDPYLLGLYHGIPKTERYSYSALPDTITIFKEPILRIAADLKDAKRIIRSTVLHEIGHHFGLSDEQLRRIEKRRV